MMGKPSKAIPAVYVNDGLELGEALPSIDFTTACALTAMYFRIIDFALLEAQRCWSIRWRIYI